jgi:aspartyl-tRNA(Asn)/glutamyl-tRNA(Gln) amidotransferase subunit C
MAEHITKQEVKRIAEYTCIALEKEELESMREDLNSIIDSLSCINDYDLTDVKPTYHPIGSLSNVMREDEVRSSFTQETALENATNTKDGYFLIPSILGQGGQK